VARAVVFIAVLVLGTALWFTVAPRVPRAQDDSSGASTRPERHFRIDNPASLSGGEAEVIYERILDRIVAAYRPSEIPAAASYRTWRRYNFVPYLSATHGNRYVNNYANAPAMSYGQLEDGASMPAGSVIVKDSFTVTRIGDVYTGALFIMEKMPPGFSPESRDWRYTMLLPDGEIFGATKGEGSENVAFCVACHKAAGDDRDHLFFVPREYRIEFLDPDSLR
jgi:hypothetical protein